MSSTPRASRTTWGIRRSGTTASGALNSWAAEIGGFEGNAQTLRLLTRLEPKMFDDEGRSFGLNLTRASLDASCKYPWPESSSVADPSGRAKFGFYADDEDAFDWLRVDAPARRQCIEAQVMDLSDDIAYSVHDFEDAVVGGFIDVAALSRRADHDAVVQAMHDWVGGEYSADELVAAFDRLAALPLWLSTWDSSRHDHGRLKNLTSELIGGFARESTDATREAFPQASLTRFSADVVVPREIRAEIAVLKGVVAAFVMAKNTRQPIYKQQRQILRSLATALFESADEHLDVGFADDWRAASDDAARKRVVVDQVASLTDQSALAWYERLVQN